MASVVAIGLFVGTSLDNETAHLEVRGIRAAWVPQNDSPGIVATFDLVNHGALKAELTEIRYTAELNGAVADDGAHAYRATLLPGASHEVPLDVRLSEAAIIAWWDGLVQGEEVRLRLHGTVNGSAGPNDLSVPFDWTTERAGKPAATIEDLAPACTANDLPCLESVQFGLVTDARQLPIKIILKAPDQTRADLADLALSLRLGDVIVAEARGEDVSVYGGYRVELPLDLEVSAPALTTWLPDHLARCETSPVTLDLSYNVTLTNLTSVRTSRVTEAIQGSPWSTSLLCRPES